MKRKYEELATHCNKEGRAADTLLGGSCSVPGAQLCIAGLTSCSLSRWNPPAHIPDCESWCWDAPLSLCLGPAARRGCLTLSVPVDAEPANSADCYSCRCTCPEPGTPGLKGQMGSWAQALPGWLWIWCSLIPWALLGTSTPWIASVLLSRTRWEQGIQGLQRG